MTYQHLFTDWPRMTPNYVTQWESVKELSKKCNIDEFIHRALDRNVTDIDIQC
jgi:hypothetical protein